MIGSAVLRAVVEDVSSRLAVRLRALRLAAGLTQAALAERARVTSETVARLERVVRHRVSANVNPSLDTLVRLATALSVDVSELLRLQTEFSSDAGSWKVRRPNLNDVFLWIAGGKALTS